ncbi:MAG: HVO_0416 family zinc finger protein [Halobacteriaceae archaeon]
MASSPDPDTESLIDEFLSRKDTNEIVTWDQSYNKLQCPECGGLHEESASKCDICGWAP